MKPSICPTYIPPHTRPKLLLIGQAPTPDELFAQRPFAGPSGRELDRLLKQAGIVRADCALANVFDVEVPRDSKGQTDLEALSVKTDEYKRLQKEGADGWVDYKAPPFKRGRYLKPDWLPHLYRLGREIAEIDPNLIVPLGDEALWALTGAIGIGAHRGAVAQTADLPWLDGKWKVLPTYHPAGIMRNYANRIPALSDLIKARREQEFAELRFPTRTLWLEPTLDDIREFKSKYLDNAELISVDIETARGQITCIAFAPSPHLSLCVPFTDFSAKWNYWKTHEDECEAWRLVRDILAMPNAKLGQNYTYDLQWLWVKMHMRSTNYLHDTRLLHHALYPELPKSLEFLGSVYENERAWKQMRAKKTDKRDE